MSNSKDGVLNPKANSEQPSHLVAYAHQCDPNNGSDWIANKRSAFGGDDGVEFLDA